MNRTQNSADSGASAGSGPHWSIYAMLVGTMALWGGTWVVGRVVSRTIAPWNAALLRFLFATLPLVLICLRIEGRKALRPARRLLLPLLLLGASGIFGYSFFFFSGLRTIGAGRAGLIVGSIPASIALFSALLGRERLRLRSAAGILLSLAGVTVLITQGCPAVVLSGKVQSGDLMILGCVLCWTAYTLIGKPVMRELPPLVTVTWSCIFGTALILPFALGSGLWHDVRQAGPAEWAGFLFLGVLATALAYYWYYNAVQKIGPIASGIFINLVPLFALLLGCLLLDERVCLSQLIGGLMIVGGVCLTLSRSPKG